MTTLTGTAAMVRLALRRDRHKLPIWVAVIAIFVPYFYYAGVQTVSAPTPEALADAAQMIRVPLLRVFAGPFFTDTGVSALQYFLSAYGVEFLLAAILMNILLIARHTRAEEQTGRAELIRAAVVGRNAQLTGALIVALIGNAALAAGVAAGALTIGFSGGSATLFGASVGAAGLVFAGFTVVTAQLTEQSRAAAGLAAVVLMVTWVFRAFGALQELEGGPLSWVSPMAWSQQTRVLADERWWPLALSLLLTGALVLVAYTLADRRDLGAAFVAPRPGRSVAAPWLRSPFTLALRLQRAAIAWWGAGFLAGGLAFGGMTGAMANLNTDSPLLAGADLERSYLSLMALGASFIAGVFVILMMARVRAEEVRGRTAPVLAGPTGRVAWLGSHLLVAALAAIGLLITYGVATIVSVTAATGDSGLAAEATLAVLVRFPEPLLLLGLAAALYGLAPKAGALAWAVLAYSGVVTNFGPSVGAPDWLLNASVLGHIPRLPLGGAGPQAMVLLATLAAGLIGLGLYGFRRRDLDGR